MLNDMKIPCCFSERTDKLVIGDKNVAIVKSDDDIVYRKEINLLEYNFRWKT